MFANFNYVALTCALCLSLIGPSCYADTEILTAEYTGEYSNWNVSMVRTLHRTEDGVYNFRSRATNAFASVTETSLFRIHNHRVGPIHYEYARKIFGRKKVEAIEFHPARNNALYLKNKKLRHTHAAPGNATDPALYQLLLQHAFKAPIETATFDFLKRNKVKNYRFDKQKEETVTIAGKPYSSVVVERRLDNKSTRIWLIPKLNNVVGKLIHTDEDGDTYSLQLKSYKANSTEMAAFYSQLDKPSAPPAKTEQAAPPAKGPTSKPL